MLKILCVDDEIFNLEILSEYLEMYENTPCKVSLATDGNSCLENIRKTHLI